MKNSTVALLTALILAMLILLPIAVPDGAVTFDASMRYMESMPVDDEYAFLYE